jgi:hypothetical protein
MPGTVEAMTIQPISAGLAPIALENNGNTGVFDIVELNIARLPTTEISRKKLRLDALCIFYRLPGCEYVGEGVQDDVKKFRAVKSNVHLSVASTMLKTSIYQIFQMVRHVENYRHRNLRGWHVGGGGETAS